MINIDFDDVNCESDIDDVEFVDVFWHIRFADGNNHDGDTCHDGNSKNHNNGGDKKENEK